MSETSLEILASIGISRRAVRDIEEIQSYSIQNWDAKTAEEYLDRTEGALKRL